MTPDVSPRIEARRQAARWVAYYEHCDIQFARDWWLRGLDTSKHWLRVTQSHSVSEQEVSVLLAAAKADHGNGSGWGLMATGIYFWAKALGHKVPPVEEFFRS
jgi:hypothetical protein